MEARLLSDAEHLACESRQLQRQIDELQEKKAVVDEQLQAVRTKLAMKPEWER